MLRIFKKTICHFLFLIIVIGVNIVLCMTIDENDDGIGFLSDYDLLEFMDLESEFRSGINGRNNSNEDPIINPSIVTVATLLGVPILLTALAPPPLPMFPPQGAIQPGSVREGGGLRAIQPDSVTEGEGSPSSSAILVIDFRN